MLGNFSFGDYFKKEAIAWCVGVSDEPGVGRRCDPERLYPSVYEEDDEAFDIWTKEIGIPEQRITRLGKEDNFWEHGAGPCGPCSEIYYDRGEKYGCGKPDCAPSAATATAYMEVWNNVFSQFDNDGHGNYSELISRRTSTRAWAWSVWRSSVEVCGLAVRCRHRHEHHAQGQRRSPARSYGDQPEDGRVPARHHRPHPRLRLERSPTVCLPSNEGRGYVLRRLLRRAARHGKLLGVNEPFLVSGLVETVVHGANECQYPELRERQDVYHPLASGYEEETFRQDHRRRHGRLQPDLLARAQGQRGEQCVLRRGRVQALMTPTASRST